MSACRYVFLVLLSGLSLPCAAAAHAEIEWRVVNRFPLFKNAHDFTELAAAWHPDGSAAPVDSAEAFLAKAVGSLNSQDAREELERLLPIDATLWDEEKGLYDRERFFYNKHRIQLKVQLPGQYCIWTVAGQTFPRTPCNDWFDPVGLEIEEKRKFSISVKASGGHRLHLHGKMIETDLIIGLGDSFASGEGNPDHPAAWSMEDPYKNIHGLSWIAQPRLQYMLVKEVAWWDLACHRSLLSWQSLYALSKAVKDIHRVVRFASFACSGAEIYDGFFRAQMIPAERGEPAIESEKSGEPKIERDFATGLVRPSYRDGGWGSMNLEERCHAEHLTAGFPHSGPDCTMLRYSQLNALTLLLCDDVSPLEAVSEEGRPVAYTAWNEFYGPYDRLLCRGKLKEPSHVLLSFGGNDMAFARVVQWGIVPDTATPGLIWPVKMLGLNLVVRKMGLGVQDPDRAGHQVEKHLGQLYSDLDFALTGFLGVPRSRVFAMLYPNPLPEKGRRTEACINRVRGGNAALGEKVRSQGLKGWVFGVQEKNMDDIDQLYIGVLRRRQVDAFKDLSWNSIDSQPAFEKDGRRMSLCGIAEDCERALDLCAKPDNACATAKELCQHDRYAVVKGERDGFPGGVVYDDSSEWLPYDSVRVRGVRTAWDAAMVQMRYPRSWVPESLDDDHAYLREPDWDWNSGTVHPTAKSHARIADLIDSSKSEGQRQVSDSRSKPDLPGK